MMACNINLRRRAAALVMGGLTPFIICANGSLAQSSEPAIFVANNGNLTGSITSYTLNPDGTLNFVQNLELGTDPEPDTNPQCISISPNGRLLATGHGTASITVEKLTIFAVASDATMTQIGQFDVHNSPLDIQWISDTHIAVLKSGSPYQMRIYHYNEAANTFQSIDVENLGGFPATLELDPQARYLYSQESSTRTISSWQINPDHTITLIDTVNTVAYPLGIGVSPDGAFIYGGGGISADRHAVVGVEIDTDTGMLSLLPNSPFNSPGNSPKQVVITADGKWAAVGHGTDATIQIFSVNQSTGELTSTGNMFDVGEQGDSGNMAVMGNRVFVTDRYSSPNNFKGVISLIVNGEDGAITEVDRSDTLGSLPWDIAVWNPASCPADLAGGKAGGDSTVNVFDLLELLANWGTSGPGATLAEPNDVVNVFDLLALLADWGPC